jgi:hypothetical protein
MVAPLGGQALPNYQWTSNGMIPIGYYAPQELGSTPVYPEMPAMTETREHRGNEEAPIRNK